MIPKPFSITDANRMQTFAASLHLVSDRSLDSLRAMYAGKAKGSHQEHVATHEVIVAEFKRREAPVSTLTCGRCGRALRSAESIARGYGRECARKRRQEAAARLVLANYSDVQAEKVRQLLEDGGAVRTGRHTFEVVASSGEHRYEVDTTTASCTCKAGQRRTPCYHLAAAQLLAA